jgi:YD repeat-containing protein
MKRGYLFAACLTAVGVSACNQTDDTQGETQCAKKPMTERREHRYDADGRLVETQVFRDGSAQPNHVWDYTYDAGGRLTSRKLTAGDVLRYSDSRTYDDAGHITAEAHQNGDAAWNDAWTYDDQGRPVERVETGTAQPLLEADGFATPRDYDPPADPLADDAPDGVRVALWLHTAQDQTWTITYGADGMAAPGPDGTHLFLTWLRTGDTRVDELDVDLDGAFDLRSTSTLGADGSVVAKRDVALKDGHEVLTGETTFDGHERIEKTYDDQGELASVTRTVYDDHGDRTLREIDQDGDGTVDWRKVYEYGSDGLRTSESRDRDADEVPDQVWHYTYDDGILTREDALEAPDGTELCDANE